MIAFDYRDNPKSEEAKIIFIYHDWTDNNKSEFETGYFQTANIADNFEQFIDNLYCSDEE